MRTSRATLTYRLLLLLAVTVTTYLAVVPAPLPADVDISDKLLHAGAFCVLFWLTDSSWPASGINPVKVSLLFGYGAMIEIIQSYIPYRDASLLDLAADGSGMLFYWLMIPLLRRLPVIGWRWTAKTP